ncbi:unnamed protein product, partial [Allacma fusca]
NAWKGKYSNVWRKYVVLNWRKYGDYDLDSEEERITTTSEPLPYFDDHFNLTNITAPLGSTAFLHCKVNTLRDKTVS